MLIAVAMAKHFLESPKMQKGHMQSSTRHAIQTRQRKKDGAHIVHLPPHRFKEVSVSIEDMKNRKIIHHGNVHRNLILVKPMKTRTSGEMCMAYNKIMQHLKN